MSDLFAILKQRLKGKELKIVFPEGTDERILTAAGRLAEEGLVKPILIGDRQAIQKKADELKVSIAEIQVLNPHSYEEMDEAVSAFVERREGKVSKGEAENILLDENYFGTMLVYLEKADGLVSGAAHSTADTVRPALQIIKAKEGVRKTSGVFIMVRDEEKYVFADCAINISPG